MSWAKRHVEALSRGETVRFRPRGSSMSGRVEDGELVTVVPADRGYAVGNVVLCKVKGRHYLHLIKAITDDRVLIGNNKGFTNGWTSRKNIYGVLAKVEP